MSKHSFEYQAPTPAQVTTLSSIRDAYKALHDTLMQLPASRERSLAITKLEESNMWVNKSIVFADEEDAG